MLHPDDPFRHERIEIARRTSANASIVDFDPYAKPEFERFPQSWQSVFQRGSERDRLAIHSYFGWRRIVDTESNLLTTRIDDDDAFAKDAIERIQKYAEKIQDPSAPVGIVLPVGYRTWRGLCSKVRHERNAWSSVLSPKGCDIIVYDIPHDELQKYLQVHFPDQNPAWLWVRHKDTLSDHREARATITSEIEKLFEVDWNFVKEIKGS